MKGQVSVSRHSCIYLCLILVLSGDSCSVSSLKRGISAAIQVSNVGLTNNNDKGPPSGVSSVSTVSAGPSATEVADGRCNNEQKSSHTQPVEEGNGAPPGVVPNAYQEAQKHANNDKKKRSGLQAIANKLRRCFRKKNNKSNACKKEGAGEKKSKKSWLNRFRFLQSKAAKSKKKKYGISSKSKAIKKTRGQKKILQ